ncbi:hypothetical protein CEP54_011592 [Fusarium duplospermum]|uniref:Uncharacterized protein n=1 Tax=Fusarium duplospermum TaxID=1325734 RepID=A0A428PDQ6_9HYPO|nr:hypothetical protein CEP54_011592 [Fusarium duplospermum]
MLGQGSFPLAARDEKCGFEGNSDLYGLGIRLGIYMQWLSAFPAMSSSSPRRIGPLADTYLIFIFAIFVAILVLTAEKRPTHAAEMSVLTYIIFGGAYTILWTSEPRREVTTMDKETVAWAAFFVYCVLGIELTLYWNGVTDVYSVRTTGQLIPLAIGACGLAQFLYAPAVDWVVQKAANRERRPREDTEAGDVATV